jgi:hypothetical protein
MTLTPTASSRGERSPKPDRVAEFGALEEARETCTVSAELFVRIRYSHPIGRAAIQATVSWADQPSVARRIAPCRIP